MSVITGCRLCGCGELKTVIDLGRTALANAYVTEEQLGSPDPTYPLTLAHCPRCSLVQLLQTVSPNALFGEYLYFSSFSETTLRHAQSLAKLAIQNYDLNESSLVVEVASNDGYLLRYFNDERVRVLGIEPAENIADAAQKNGIPTINAFFDEALAAKLAEEGYKADLIVANNVIAHVPDINGFVRGFGRLLRDTGAVIVEIPYLRNIIERCEFDMIYHEHLCYYSLGALCELFRKNDLIVNRVERIPIQGGSLRLFVRRRLIEDDSSVQSLLADEDRSGLREYSYYADFATRIQQTEKTLSSLVSDIKKSGARIAAYGAAAKATTLLHCLGLGRETIDFIVDRSPMKQSRFMPGNHIPILPTTELLERMPDYTLILAWNYADEILEQEARYRKMGGKFIIPIPQPVVV